MEKARFSEIEGALRTLNVKMAQKSPDMARIPSIFGISDPKLTKSTWSHKFRFRVTIPPPPSPPGLNGDVIYTSNVYLDAIPLRLFHQLQFPMCRLTFIID